MLLLRIIMIHTISFQNKVNMTKLSNQEINSQSRNAFLYIYAQDCFETYFTYHRQKGASLVESHPE